jgi:putative membrane protein
MLIPSLQKNDRKANTFITIVSIVVFAAVTVLGKYNLAGRVNLPFDEHIFAFVSAATNATVAILLLAGLITVKNRNLEAHKKIMLAAMGLSILFLLCYIAHHLFAGETSYGETDGIKGLSLAEKNAAGSMRSIYLIILFTHIPLAGLILPFILSAAYRALTGEYDKHKKLVRYVWPVWFYVAVTGVIIYWMIRPYYS